MDLIEQLLDSGFRSVEITLVSRTPIAEREPRRIKIAALNTQTTSPLVTWKPTSRHRV